MTETQKNITFNPDFKVSFPNYKGMFMKAIATILGTDVETFFGNGKNTTQQEDRSDLAVKALNKESSNTIKRFINGS